VIVSGAVEHLCWQKSGYEISTDPARLQIDVLHDFLRTAYWCEGIPREVLERAVAHSVNFGLFRAPEQVGYARVVTDRATFGYLTDVFVLPAHRGRGLARWLVATALEHPELQGFRRWMLATRDAHGVYAGVGFLPLGDPALLMEIFQQDVYRATHGRR
jgi:GNAT superfamily N-acetyltransferase